MKLYYAPASPYSRKVRVAAIELGLGDKLELVLQMPRDNSTGFFSINPLARIPVLVGDDGTVVYDSPVICEYLDGLGNGRLCPASGPSRVATLRRQAIGDGLLDNLVPLRGELARPKEQQSKEYIERAYATVDRTLQALEKECGDLGAKPDIGDIAIGCALGYLDFRYPDRPWRKSNPTLAAWFDALSRRRSFIETSPTQ